MKNFPNKKNQILFNSLFWASCFSISQSEAQDAFRSLTCSKSAECFEPFAKVEFSMSDEHISLRTSLAELKPFSESDSESITEPTTHFETPDFKDKQEEIAILLSRAQPQANETDCVLNQARIYAELFKRSPQTEVLFQRLTQNALFTNDLSNHTREPDSINLDSQRSDLSKELNMSLETLVPNVGLNGESNFRNYGDVFQYANPLLAYGQAGQRGDEEGQKQFLLFSLVSVATVQGLKVGLNSTPLGERPNGGDGSMPSGHKAAAHSAAAFIRMRYGFEEAIPYYLLSMGVGLSRVDAGVHHPRDIIVGALLEEALAEIMIRNQNKNPKNYHSRDKTAVDNSPRIIWSPWVESRNYSKDKVEQIIGWKLKREF